MVKLISVVKNNSGKNPTKRFIANFDDGTKTYFGLANPKGKGTYIDHKDKKIRDAYIARHKTDLKTKDPKRAGYLSMFLLWNKISLKASVKDYNTRLNSNNWALP